jgi:hypothetical protein
MGNNTVGTQTNAQLKDAVDFLSECLVAYATSSEVATKLAEFIPGSRSILVGRILVALLGMFVLGYISFVEESYKFINKVLAGLLLFCLILPNFALSVYRLISDVPAIPRSFASQDIAQTEWKVEQLGGEDTINMRTYSTKIKVHEEMKGKYKHISIYIKTYKGFKLLNVYPISEIQKPLEKKKQPLEMEDFRETGSKWFFPSFDEQMIWKIIVQIKKEEQTQNFPNQAPLIGTLEFYQERWYDKF